VPTASEAAPTMETPEAATHMAETSDTHAMTETVTSEMGGTYAVAETHAASLNAHAVT
jgi:hypothetical protein